MNLCIRRRHECSRGSGRNLSKFETISIIAIPLSQSIIEDMNGRAEGVPKSLKACKAGVMFNAYDIHGWRGKTQGWWHLFSNPRAQVHKKEQQCMNNEINPNVLLHHPVDRSISTAMTTYLEHMDYPLCVPNCIMWWQ